MAMYPLLPLTTWLLLTIIQPTTLGHHNYNPATQKSTTPSTPPEKLPFFLSPQPTFPYPTQKTPLPTHTTNFLHTHKTRTPATTTTKPLPIPTTTLYIYNPPISLPPTKLHPQNYNSPKKQPQNYTTLKTNTPKTTQPPEKHSQKHNPPTKKPHPNTHTTSWLGWADLVWLSALNFHSSLSWKVNSLRRPIRKVDPI